MRRAVSAHSPYRTIIAPALRPPWSGILYAPTAPPRYIHCPIGSQTPCRESAMVNLPCRIWRLATARLYDNQALLPKQYDLAWIKDVLRIKRPLDGPHRAQRALTVLCRQIFHLALADAVLARTSPVHG
jgi:hypothetical protein